MNTFVVSYTPKTKTFCETISLETRAGIAARVMIVGYAKLYKMVYEKLGLDMDLALLKPLHSCDRKKTSKNVVQRTMSGNNRRRDGGLKRNTEKHVASIIKIFMQYWIQ